MLRWKEGEKLWGCESKPNDVHSTLEGSTAAFLARQWRVHARAPVGPPEAARGGILNLFKYDVGFTFTLVLAALQHFCISPSFERPGVRAGLQGRHSDGALGDAPRRARPNAQLVEKMC